MKNQNTPKTSLQFLKHQKEVVNAVFEYCCSEFMTISKLAKSFNVSENTISIWFCEAVEKRYITSDAICHQVMTKHIKEYEEKHMISNSCLRAMYKAAFEERTNVNSLTVASA